MRTRENSRLVDYDAQGGPPRILK